MCDVLRRLILIIGAMMADAVFMITKILRVAQQILNFEASY